MSRKSDTDPRPKVRGSFATYVQRSGIRICELDELAKQLMNWGATPRSIGDVKAMELALLAEDYLRLVKEHRSEG